MSRLRRSKSLKWRRVVLTPGEYLLLTPRDGHTPTLGDIQRTLLPLPKELRDRVLIVDFDVTVVKP